VPGTCQKGQAGGEGGGCGMGRRILNGQAGIGGWMNARWLNGWIVDK
jgi:hypothetical protein